MKLTHVFPLILLTGGFLAVPGPSASAQTSQDPIAVARSAIKADRQAVVQDALQLTPAESENFWPLYHAYRAEMDKVGDGLLKVIREYAGFYPNIPEDSARKLLDELIDLEQKQVAVRAVFLRKTGDVLPASKTLRFAQVEKRLDLALQLKLAANIPLVPVEGTLIPQAGGAVSAVAGVPGGAVVKVVQLSASVIAIDPASRKITLLSPDGIKKTVKAGPDVVNFDQIRVSDQLKVKATQELVVRMAKAGESADDGSAGLVALAPEGAKPGGLAAETTRVTATVTAIDEQNHTATLRFEDGSTRTFPVRNDVDLGKRKVGEQVVFRYTEMMAISIEKP